MCIRDRGTHCVDNSPTPEAARRFVSKLPGVGEERAKDVLAYEFMADFRVHARLREGGEADDGGGTVQLPESVVKPAYMSLPPSIGIPSIAPSCFACCTPRAAAASALCVPRRPARPVPKLTSLASGCGRALPTRSRASSSRGSPSMRVREQLREAERTAYCTLGYTCR